MTETITPTINPIENNTAQTVTVESPSTGAPHISERDAFAMPIDDLKKAAFEEPQPAPVAQPDPQPQAQPANTGPYTLTQDGDTFVLKYATGEVFKGANELEVYKKAAENAVRNIEWAKQVKKQYDEFQQNPAKPVAMPDQPANPEEQARQMEERRQIFLEGLSDAIGMTPEELRQQWANMKARTDAFDQQAAVMDFYKKNSETYIDTPENQQAIIKGLQSMGISGRSPSAQELTTAWSLALLEGYAVPATPASMQPKRPPMPPPMPTMGGGMSRGDSNPWSMDMDALKKAAGLG